MQGVARVNEWCGVAQFRSGSMFSAPACCAAYPGSLLTVDTEVNGDSKSTNERVLSLVGSLGSSYFFPHRTLFHAIYVSPSPSELGRQSCRVACL